MHKKVETFSKYAVHKKWIDWNIVCGMMSKRCQQTQFMSTAGFGNKMKLRSRLPPFSLICIWCQRAFCLRLCHCLHLSKFGYTRTVRLGTLGCFRFHVWDCVLCRLTGNYNWYCDKFSRIRNFSLARLIQRLTILPDIYAFVRIRLK